MLEVIVALVLIVALGIFVVVYEYKGRAKRKNDPSSCGYKEHCSRSCPTCFQPADPKDEKCQWCGTGLPKKSE